MSEVATLAADGAVTEGPIPLQAPAILTAHAHGLCIDRRVVQAARPFVLIITTWALDEAGQNAGLGPRRAESGPASPGLPSGADVTLFRQGPEAGA